MCVNLSGGVFVYLCLDKKYRSSCRLKSARRFGSAIRRNFMLWTGGSWAWYSLCITSLDVGGEGGRTIGGGTPESRRGPLSRGSRAFSWRRKLCMQASGDI